MTTTARVAAGVPTGGEFAASGHVEPGVARFDPASRTARAEASAYLTQLTRRSRIAVRTEGTHQPATVTTVRHHPAGVDVAIGGAVHSIRPEELVSGAVDIAHLGVPA